MKSKKTKKANLESKRSTFFLVGLVAALGVTLVAFEWQASPGKAKELARVQTQVVEDEIIPIVRDAQLKPPPPPPPKVVDIITIVDNDVEIDKELDIEDSEADETTIIDVAPLIEATEEKEVEEKIFFNVIEEPAEFPGGERALYKYISDHVEYPIIAQENGIQGKVYVKFIVDEKGLISNAQILRGVDDSLNKEALRVINSLPRFRPGKQRGRAVKVYYNSVINFQLQ